METGRETPSRLTRLLRKKIGRETTRKRIIAAAMPPSFYEWQFSAARTFHPQLLIPPRTINNF